MPKIIEISLELVTKRLNALKSSPDYWSSKAKQAEYMRLLEYRDQLIQKAQFGNCVKEG